MEHRPSNESSLCCPLDQLFASKGQVRLLRVLAREPGTPHHPADLAGEAALSESRARQALNRLVRTGLVERIPEGRTTRYSLRRGAPLCREITRLFQKESSRSLSLVGALRGALRRLPRRPAVAWIQDYLPGWGGEGELGLHFVEPAEVDFVRLLEERLTPVREEFQILLESRLYSSAELSHVDWESVMLVVGSRPGAVNGPVRDANAGAEGGCRLPLNPSSSEFSCALAALLEENLSVLLRARENVKGKLDNRPNGHAHDLWEWKKILDTLSLPQLLQFLESESPRALRLRKCSPFPEVLSEQERTRLAELRKGLS